MPKLKVGDTFVYTKEMNAAKKKSHFDNNAKELIGSTLEIDYLTETSNWRGSAYAMKNDRKGNLFMVDVIDTFLPEELSPSLKEKFERDGKAYSQAEALFQPKIEKLTQAFEEVTQKYGEERTAKVELLSKDITTREYTKQIEKHSKQILILLDKIKKL